VSASLREALNHSFVTGERFSTTYRLRRADGVYRWVEGSAEPLLDESGRILQWYGLSHDIDDQLRVEEALRRSERQLQQLIDTVPVQIWCVTPGGEPAYINKTMMDYIGLKLEDFDAEQGLAGAIQAIVHPDDRIPLERALTHSFSTGEAFELKFRNRRRRSIGNRTGKGLNASSRPAATLVSPVPRLDLRMGRLNPAIRTLRSSHGRMDLSLPALFEAFE
jgi:PAS domain-containing protein